MAARTVEIIILGKDQASKALGGVGKSLGALGKLGLVGGAGVVAVGGALAKFAIDAAPIEGISAAFEGLTEGMVGGSEAVLSALTESSLGMVTQTELMRGFNNASQLVGSALTDQLGPAMGYLSRISAATGTDMDYLLSSLTTGIGRLSPMILDNLMIQVNAAEANEVWAEKMGVSVEAMSKSEQQAALMDQVMMKLAENTANMPAITDNASTKMAQFETTLANAKDQIGVALLPIFTELMGAFGDFAAEQLPKLIAGFQNDFVPFLTENVIPIIKTLVGWIQEYLPVAIDILEDVISNILIPAFTDVWEFIEDPLIPFIITLVEWIQENLPTAIAFIKNVIDTILVPAFTAVWKFIEDPLIPIITSLVAWLQENIPAAIEAVSVWWKNTGQGIFQSVVNFLADPVISTISLIVDWLQTNIPDAIDALSNWWKNTGQGIFQAVVDFLMEPVISTLTDIVSWLQDNIPAAIDALSQWWTNTGQGIFQIIVDFFEDPIILTIKKIVHFLGDEEGGLQKAFRGIGDFWDKTGGWIFSKIANSVASVVKELKAIVTWVANAIRSLEDWARQVKPDIGFGGGIPGRGPGSPGWKGEQQFGGFWPGGGNASLHANEMVLPLNNRAGIDALAQAMQIAGQTNISLTANYAFQDRESLSADVRMLQMLYSS